ncbi:MAG: HAMP domain-containing histidine kinase [Bdellovibrio sp.]|nr:HAMP domain-containing histidine kinase [Bdellovibrio sp.]
MFLKLNRLFLKSLSFRLTFGYAILFVLSSFLILFLNYYLFNHSIKDRDHEILSSKAKEYSSVYSKGGVQELKNYLAAQKQSDTDSQFLVRIESVNSETLFLHIPEKMQQLSASEVDKKISTLTFSKNISKFYMSERSIEDPEEENEYEVVSQINSDGQRIQVARNTDERDDLLERYLRTILSASFAVLLIGSFGGFVFSKQALAPLRNLIQAIKLVRSGELSARVPVRNSNDEIDEIGILFNKMATKIENLISNMHETLDNVAHDLRTPLTRLKSKAELTLLSQFAATADYKEALANTIENAAEIVSLINTIMDISEAEAGVLKLDLVEINATDVILEIIDLYAMIAEEKNISLQFVESVNFNFYADRIRCKQVLSNLLDNAIKYSPKNSLIEIISQSFDGKNEICILDVGIGISAQDVPKIWSRLYRVHHNQSNKGLGLGLSLVHSICKAHGWTIQVQSQLGVGSEFKLTFTNGA